MTYIKSTEEEGWAIWRVDKDNLCLVASHDDEDWREDIPMDEISTWCLTKREESWSILTEEEVFLEVI